MSEASKKQKFDPVKVLAKAVKRELARKKALGQYAVIFQNGEVKKIQFN